MSGMRNIKLILEYDGTHYLGWQVQPSGPTVQKCLEDAMHKITGERVSVSGAGRTDAGVHATGQVASCRITSQMSTEKMRLALNAVLPRDIVVKSLEEVDASFHARYSAKSKRYRYTILNRKAPSAIDRHCVVHISRPLDVGAIRGSARALVGTHDFSSFACNAGRDYDPVRNILELAVDKKGDYVIIEIEADGFLYKMVRSIVGALIEVGKKKLTPADIVDMLGARDRRKAPATAPAKGLMLIAVNY